MEETSLPQRVILFGAGGAGRYALSHLRSLGIEPLLFADNDPAKQGTTVSGIEVQSPAACHALWPSATWVACSIKHQFAVEIRAEIRAMGVETMPLWKVLPVCHGVPSIELRCEIAELLMHDLNSGEEWWDQLRFREKPDYDLQSPPSDISELYFPDFIAHLDGESFLDAGACQGDTITEFLSRWSSYAAITALEPDLANYRALKSLYGDNPKITLAQVGVSDHSGIERFQANGDFSSHLNPAGAESIVVEKIDQLRLDTPPTYIKLDVEGSELAALWGARRTLKQHMPVLAVCAYHTSDHLWEIPLLVYAIQPEYRAYLKRYAEGAYELVWYFVPPERVAK